MTPAPVRRRLVARRHCGHAGVVSRPRTFSISPDAQRLTVSTATSAGRTTAPFGSVSTFAFGREFGPPKGARHARKIVPHPTQLPCSRSRRGLLLAPSVAAGDARSNLPSGTDASQTSTAKAGAIRPFRVDVPAEDLADLRRRIAATRWPDRETVNDQSQGIQLAKIQELVRLLGHGLRLAKGRGQAECPAAVHDQRSTASTSTSSTSARSIPTPCR